MDIFQGIIDLLTARITSGYDRKLGQFLLSILIIGLFFLSLYLFQKFNNPHIAVLCLLMLTLISVLLISLGIKEAMDAIYDLRSDQDVKLLSVLLDMTMPSILFLLGLALLCYFVIPILIKFGPAIIKSF